MKKLMAIMSAVMIVTAGVANAETDSSWVEKSFKEQPRVESSKRTTREVKAPQKDIITTIADGLASFYWQPQRVASGGWFNPNAMTAAHKTLPFGTRVRVTNQRNGKSVDVTINDRGPYIAGRVIDLSKAAAAAIDMTNSGVVPVKIAKL